MNSLEKYLAELVKAQHENTNLIGKMVDKTESLLEKITNLKNSGSGLFGSGLLGSASAGAVGYLASRIPQQLQDKMVLNKRKEELEDRKEKLKKNMESTAAEIKMKTALASSNGTRNFSFKDLQDKERERYSVERQMNADKSKNALKNAFNDFQKAKEMFGVKNLKKLKDTFTKETYELTPFTDKQVQKSVDKKLDAVDEGIKKSVGKSKKPSGLEALIGKNLAGKLTGSALGAGGAILGAAAVGLNAIAPGQGSAGSNFQQYQNQSAQAGDNAWSLRSMVTKSLKDSFTLLIKPSLGWQGLEKIWETGNRWNNGWATIDKGIS